MRINNNVMAFNAYRNLSQTSGSLGKSLERLSSGLRINRAADDAAGLVKSEELRSEVNGAKTAMRNAQDGISLVQTAEGALNEVTSMLQRMRTLAISAANTATNDGVAEQAEFEQLALEIDNIGQFTNFSGLPVFSSTSLTFQIGGQAGAVLGVEIGGLSSTSLGASGTLAGIDLDNAASTAIGLLDTAISSVSTMRSDLGATQNRMESTIRNLGVAAENLTAAESRIRDADMAEEMSDFTRNQILQQAGTAMLAQANQVPQSVLSLLQ